MVERSEAPPYYFKYIDLVPRGDICAILDTQLTQTYELLSNISDDHSRFRYAPDRWSIREVAGHVNDAERLFTFRAFWFARGFDAPLPSFEQTVAAQHAGAEERSWVSHVEEFSRDPLVHTRVLSTSVARRLASRRHRVEQPVHRAGIGPHRCWTCHSSHHDLEAEIRRVEA
jgi:hypothetical protein